MHTIMIACKKKKRKTVFQLQEFNAIYGIIYNVTDKALCRLVSLTGQVIW